MTTTALLHCNVTDFLLDGKPRDRVALQFVGRSHTYGELDRAAGCIAGHCVNSLRTQKGDRVILVADNSFFWVASYLGILRAGLVCVPLPLGISPQDLAYVLEAADVGTVFAQALFAARRSEQFRSVQVVTDRQLPGIMTRCGEGADAGDALPEIEPDDLAALMFTSGSTGRPRGVMVSHANIMANTASIIQSLDLTENDRMMAVLPFHYCFGTSLLHTHLRVGGSLVCDARFMYPEDVLQRMISTQCTGFAGVPSHFQILLRNSSLKRKTFPHLRHVQQAGGHLAPCFIRELRDALPGTQIYIMYGQTEATARLSCLPAEYLEAKLGSIGKGIPGVALRVLDQGGRDVRPGEVGEIVAEGGNVCCGYWRAPEESAASFRDGRLYTGDLATVDEDGFIYVVDRSKDFIKRGGKRISCRQIEDELLTCDELLEAAVVGVPDEVLGEAAKAFVVPRVPDADDLVMRLRLFCKMHVSPQFTPRDIVVVGALPKNSSGKVLKAQLRAGWPQPSPAPDDARAIPGVARSVAHTSTLS